MKIIGVTGGSGSGKTTFAKKVISQLPSDKVSILHMDSYYLDEQPEQYYTKSGAPNFDHPAAFDWELLRTHIFLLKSGKSIEVPVYDFKTNRRLNETKTIENSSIVILEGIFSLFDQDIREQLNIKAFLHVEADIRFTRRLNRDVQERGRSLESVTSQYYETVRPMYEKYLAPQKQYADFIVGEETDVASSILAAKLKEYIGELNSYSVLLNNKNEDSIEKQLN